jgi:hypothetical protein
MIYIYIYKEANSIWWSSQDVYVNVLHNILLDGLIQCSQIVHVNVSWCEVPYVNVTWWYSEEDIVRYFEVLKMFIWMLHDISIEFSNCSCECYIISDEDIARFFEVLEMFI